MSVIIIGMEMPKKCCDYEYHCPLIHVGGYCPLANEFINFHNDDRSNSCPLREVKNEHAGKGIEACSEGVRRYDLMEVWE